MIHIAHTGCRVSSHGLRGPSESCGGSGGGRETHRSGCSHGHTLPLGAVRGGDSLHGVLELGGRGQAEAAAGGK